MSNICKQCGIVHTDQIRKYPVGAKVKATRNIPVNASNSVQAGETAVVMDHCVDGRAVFNFQQTDSVHTFHNPDSFVEVTSTPEPFTNLFPQQPQRQDSLRNQLSDLIALANRAGMYDAADWVVQRLGD